MFKITNISFLILNIIFAFLIIKKHIENKEKESAFNECISEVSNKCSSVISYAVMLEKENSKLNKRPRSCDESR